MSDEQYRVSLRINLPPDAQFQQGHSLILEGDDLGQIQLMLAAADTVTDPIIRRILDYAKAGGSAAAAPATPAPPAAGTVQVLTAEQAAQAMGVPAPVILPPPVPAPVGAAPTGPPVAPQPVQVPLPYPQGPPPVPMTPGQPLNLVDGGQVGGTPGQRYPANPGGGQLSLGGPCPRCGVVTYWQPPGTNFQTGQPYQGYYRCPNAKNHPK